MDRRKEADDRSPNRLATWVQRFLDAYDSNSKIPLGDYLETVPEDIRDAVREDCERWLEIVAELEPGEHEPPARANAGQIEVPGYRDLRILGEGGMAVVWSAIRDADDTEVAIKVLKARLASVAEYRERFAREATIGRELDHPGIVPVLDSGACSDDPPPQSNDIPYLVLPLVKGPTLAEELRTLEAPMPAKEIARIAIEVLRALEHCHEHDVVHRDLKPGNILLENGDTPRIIDFGLARVDLESSLTQVGALVGTLAYMSPEQAVVVGNPKVDARTDVYSLGAVVYSMLTGGPPFREREDSNALLRDILFTDPNPPSRAGAHVHRDLETICLKALEKSPQHRYQSAALMREDLERFLRAESIHARPVRAIIRVGRRLSRRKALMGAFGGAAAAMATLGSWGLLSDPRPRLRVNAPADCRISLQRFDEERLRYGPASAHGRASLSIKLDPGRYRVGVVRSAKIFAEASILIRDEDVDLSPQLQEGKLTLRDTDEICRDMLHVTDDEPFAAGMPGENLRIHEAYTEKEKRAALEPFALDRREVSFGEFKAFLAATGYAVSSKLAAFQQDQPDAASDARPVVGITRTDAEAYALWAGKRLPTMLEWERVARGTSNRRRVAPERSLEDVDAVFGNGRARDLPDLDAIYAAFEETARATTSAGDDDIDGVLHLMGNVCEFIDDYYVAPDGKIDPNVSMIKGGAWCLPASRTGFDRLGYTPSKSSDSTLAIGFRCAKSLRSPFGGR